MFTAAQIAAMDDREMAMHASGSYGPKLRNEFTASVRLVAEKADAKNQILSAAFGKRERAQSGEPLIA